jgi:hypothetical protein
MTTTECLSSTERSRPTARFGMKQVILASLVLLATTFSYAQSSGGPTAPAPRDGAHDFDFEIGTWITRVSRLTHPLTGSTTWVEFDGTSVVRKVWDGRANLVELDVTGPSGHIEALSMRLYNPEAHQWSLNFSNSNSETGVESFSTRSHLAIAAFWCDSSFPRSALTCAGSSRRFPAMGGRPGK